MAVEYSILLSKRCVDEAFLTQIIRKIYTGKLDPVFLEKGFKVSNIRDEIGFSYSLIEVNEQPWGWEDEFLKNEFRYVQRIGFRCDSFFDAEKRNRNLYTVIFLLISSIDCDMIILQNDVLLFVKKKDEIFVRKGSVEWLSQNFHDLTTNFSINLIPLETPI